MAEYVVTAFSNRPNVIAVGLTFLGAGLIGYAHFEEYNNWLMSVLINLGATLVLFALLVYSEGRLFGKLRGPKSLEDACGLASEALDRLSRRRSEQPAANADPKVFAKNIGTLIRCGKFVPATPDSDSLFAYEAKGCGVTWTVSWKEPGRIVHEIRIPDRARPLVCWTPLPTASGSITVSQHVRRSER
ncbi:MAG: hypothetical protein ACREQV_27045, partial [Candidatus Binatia bacterium]